MSSYDNPFSGMITRESRLNTFNPDSEPPSLPPMRDDDETPF